MESGIIPWETNPYSLVSWWDMEKFAADKFCVLCASLQHLVESYSREPDARLLFQDRTNLVGDLNAVLDKCHEVGLEVSARQIQAFVDTLTNRDFTHLQVAQTLAGLGQAISCEMSTHLFMFLPTEQAVRYDQKELLGKDVNAKFPTIQYDIVEAGNCYACGRSTAVVFHLMRIMEVGLQVLGTKLGIPLTDEKVWQVILDGVNAEIKKLPKGDPSTVELSQIAANLYSVKLAWRNQVMHPKDTYTLEEADSLIRQVKIFMEQLTKVV